MDHTLQISALPAADLDRIRARGIDDHGNPLEYALADGPRDIQLRCCLRYAVPGERYALLAWSPSPRPGACSEVGPLFVHADPCDGWQGEGYPEELRLPRQLFRAYDDAGRQVDNVIAAGADVEHVLTGLLGREDVSFVHSRNVLAGCYIFSAVRS